MQTDLIPAAKQLLATICENPGWEPTPPVSGETEALIHALNTDRWITSGMDGWHATPVALAHYPFSANPEPKILDLDHKATLTLRAGQRIRLPVRLEHRYGPRGACVEGKLVLENSAGEIDVEVTLAIRPHNQGGDQRSTSETPSSASGSQAGAT